MPMWGGIALFLIIKRILVTELIPAAYILSVAALGLTLYSIYSYRFRMANVGLDCTNMQWIVL